MNHTTKTRHYGKRRQHVVFVDGTSPDYPAPPYSMIGEDPENDMAWKVYNAEEVRLMKEAASTALDLPVKAFKFSRKAGCTCPCSPGLLIEPTPQLTSGYATWVTVTS